MALSYANYLLKTCILYIAFGRGVASLNTNCHYSSLTTLKAACQASETVQQRQKEVTFNKNDFHSSHKDLCKTSSDTSDYLMKHKKDIESITNSSTEYLSVQQQIQEFQKMLGSSEQLSQNHQRESSTLSSSSTELSHLFRESSLSISTTRESSMSLSVGGHEGLSGVGLHRRDSRKSSSSSEVTASPTAKDAPKTLDSPQQRGSLTLPLQKKPAPPARYQLHVHSLYNRACMKWWWKRRDVFNCFSISSACHSIHLSLTIISFSVALVLLFCHLNLIMIISILLLLRYMYKF